MKERKYVNKEIKKDLMKLMRFDTKRISEALYDDNDHFGFICGDCKSHLDIYIVDIYPEEKQLYFDMLCPKCYSRYTRKIYLDAVRNKKAMPRVYDEGKIRPILKDEKHLTEIVIHKRKYKNKRNKIDFEEKASQNIDVAIKRIEGRGKKEYSTKTVISLLKVLKKIISDE